jgi:hypothetical protein
MTDFDSIPSGDGGARRQAAAASSDAASAKRSVSELEHELARLKLVCAAVWELVKDKTGLTEDDLVAKAAILDAKDGVADGELTRGIRKCIRCSRTVPARQNKCMYCKTTQPLSSVFEDL